MGEIAQVEVAVSTSSRGALTAFRLKNRSFAPHHFPALAKTMGTAKMGTFVLLPRLAIAPREGLAPKCKALLAGILSEDWLPQDERDYVLRLTTDDSVAAKYSQHRHSTPPLNRLTIRRPNFAPHSLLHHFFNHSLVSAATGRVFPEIKTDPIASLWDLQSDHEQKEVLTDHGQDRGNGGGDGDHGGGASDTEGRGGADTEGRGGSGSEGRGGSGSEGRGGAGIEGRDDLGKDQQGIEGGAKRMRAKFVTAKRIAA